MCISALKALQLGVWYLYLNTLSVFPNLCFLKKKNGPIIILVKRMKEMGSWIDYWYSSFPILHWFFGTWLRTTGRAGILGGGDWIILQSSSSVNYHSFFEERGARWKGGGRKRISKPPRLSCGSLIDCIGALYDKASSLKEAGFNLHTCVYSKSLSGFKNAVNLSAPHATILE